MNYDFKIYLWLIKHNGAILREITKEFGISNATATRCLKKLMDAGLIDRMQIETCALWCEGIKRHYVWAYYVYTEPLRTVFFQ